jgi:hypothetical protein
MPDVRDNLTLFTAMFFGLFVCLACGTTRTPLSYRPSASIAPAKQDASVRLVVNDTRADPHYLGEARMVGVAGTERLELERPAAELVERAVSQVLTEAGYKFSRDADLVYHVTISEFTTNLDSYAFTTSHATSHLILDIEIERGGSIVSRKQIMGQADIPVPFTKAGSPLRYLACWFSCAIDWHLFGVPGIEEATTEAFREALDHVITDSDIALALDPYAVPLSDRADSEHHQSPYRRRVAVVIGISDYWLWPRRENSLVDASRVARTLREGGFDEVIELYDARATRQEILSLLGTELQSKISANDLVLIYFTGHGATETLSSGQTLGYIVPVDADTRWVFSTAISMAELRDLSDRLAAKHIYFSMASCFSGVDFAQPLPTPADRSTYNARIRTARSVQMITAGRDGEKTLLEAGEGIFTSFWIRGLLGEADRDYDGYVTGSELGDYVTLRVELASGNRQSPQSGRLEGGGEPLFLLR